MAAGDMRDIKRRVKGIKSMEHITNAMKLVSSAKLTKAMRIFEKNRENFHYVIESIQEICNHVDDIPKRYLMGNREIRNTAYIIVTSSRGLCGSFNNNVIKAAEAEMGTDLDQPFIVAIGSKGRDYFQKKGYEIHSEYMLPPENISFMHTHDISKPIIDMYDQGIVDEVMLVYTSFISSLEHKVVMETLLPFEATPDPSFPELDRYVEYEPSIEEVFNYLIPKYVEIMIYTAIIESATCEHAARRMAMENATDSAREMIEELSLYYNRARQAAITSEISEIVGGADALNKR